MGKSSELHLDIRESESHEPVSSYSLANQLTDLVKPLQLTKAASEGMAEMIATIVKEGNANPLDVSTRLQWMATVIEQARKLIQEDCISEIEKHSGKAVINGAEVVKKETGVKYDFENCGDTEWEIYDSKEASAKASKKEREKFLKALTKPITIANEETGEMQTVNPPIKSSTTNIQVTLK
jgi:hypothetical protein